GYCLAAPKPGRVRINQRWPRRRDKMPSLQGENVGRAPRVVMAGPPIAPGLACPYWPGAPAARTDLRPAESALLLRLQRQALQYFIDTQPPGGLVLDRQRNHGPIRLHGLCSTAATGMGLIALALAAARPYRLLTPPCAVHRVRATLQATLDRLPHDRGVV